MRKTAQRGFGMLTFLIMLGFAAMFGVAYFSGGGIFGGISRCIYIIGEYFDQENPYYFKDFVDSLQKTKHSDLPTGDIAISPSNGYEYMLRLPDIEISKEMHNWLYLGNSNNGYQVLWTGENTSKFAQGARVKALMAVNKDSDQYYVVYAVVGANHQITVNDSENGLYDFNDEEGTGFSMALLEYRSRPILLESE